MDKPYDQETHAKIWQDRVVRKFIQDKMMEAMAAAYKQCAGFDLNEPAILFAWNDEAVSVVVRPTPAKVLPAFAL